MATATIAKIVLDGANGTNTPKDAILEMHSIATMRENRAMYDALCEGRMGAAFRLFHASDPKGAMRVIQAALVFWGCSEYNPGFRTSRGIKDMPGDLIGIGAYAHSYTEIVAQMAEPYLPHWTYHFGPIAWQRDAWEWFAQNVATGRK
jgi:hypothetical protein